MADKLGSSAAPGASAPAVPTPHATPQAPPAVGPAPAFGPAPGGSAAALAAAAPASPVTPAGGTPLVAPSAALTERRVHDRRRQIFVNRNLKMENIDAVGFDMDYTLALYNQPELEDLSNACTLAKMVQDRGYPDEVASVHVDPSFAVRGLVIDKEHGHLLKMDRHYHVGRCYHGYRELTREERHALYAHAKVNLSSPRFVWIDTLFALPDAALYGALVDFFERRGQPCDYAKLFTDIRESIDEAHRDGSIKDVISRDPTRYVVKDPDLAETLHKFRSSGKRLFVLTNSEPHYTELVMRHLLGGSLAEYPSWRHFFDAIVVNSRKPDFFTGTTPFHDVVDAEGNLSADPSVGDGFERGKLYSGGNIADFERRFGFAGDSILYVGDHIYGDMLKANKGAAWRTAMILQEMERELDRWDATLPERQRIMELEERRQILDYDSQHETGRFALAKRRGATEAAVKAMRLRVDALRREQKRVIAEIEEARDQQARRYNPYWGSIFRVDNEKSAFGAQVERYAALYTGRVSNFLYYSPVNYFVSPPEMMPHER
jgi:HAD superfamily 5'-nucleotidase-like hydrolase